MNICNLTDKTNTFEYKPLKLTPQEIEICMNRSLKRAMPTRYSNNHRRRYLDRGRSPERKGTPNRGRSPERKGTPNRGYQKK